MFTRPFLMALLERAAKTAAQSASGLLVVAMAAGHVDWVALGSTTGLITLASVLTTLGSGAITGGNASLATGSEVTDPEAGRHERPDDA